MENRASDSIIKQQVQADQGDMGGTIQAHHQQSPQMPWHCVRQAVQGPPWCLEVRLGRQDGRRYATQHQAKGPIGRAAATRHRCCFQRAVRLMLGELCHTNAHMTTATTAPSQYWFKVTRDVLTAHHDAITRCFLHPTMRCSSCRTFAANVAHRTRPALPHPSFASAQQRWLATIAPAKRGRSRKNEATSLNSTLSENIVVTWYCL